MKAGEVRVVVAVLLFGALAVPAFLGARKVLARARDDPFAPVDVRIRARLASARMSVNLDNTPANEFASLVEDLSASRYTRQPEIRCVATRSTETLKLTFQCRNV